ncbi:MAG: hypothetical protein IPM32_06365 [Ignavibacteriae bacterium]|nr:hypothetical protein [Ignavibacteriota bacterium]
MKKIFVTILILFTITNFAQDKNAEKIISAIKSKIDKVDNYSANVEISVKFDFLKMPKSKAEIFFKKPDKFKLHSEKLTILPKGVIDFNPQKIIDKDFTSELIGDTLIDNKNLSVIKIIPNADSIKFNAAKLLVDKNEFLIKQIILSLDGNAKIITYFNYNDQKEFALPSQIKINLDFSQVEESENKRRRNIPENFKGDITINYNNYKVNKGIDDSVFVDEKEAEK